MSHSDKFLHIIPEFCQICNTKYRYRPAFLCIIILRRAGIFSYITARPADAFDGRGAGRFPLSMKGLRPGRSKSLPDRLSMKMRFSGITASVCYIRFKAAVEHGRQHHSACMGSALEFVKIDL